MKTCFRCGRQIKGRAVMHIPPLYMVKMGIDFEKAFHPKCYEMEEDEEEMILKGEAR
jgi:hypothetical protein